MDDPCSGKRKKQGAMAITTSVGRSGMRTEQPRLIPLFDLIRCKRCGVCAYICPQGAVSQPPGDQPLLDPEACTACWKCELICPDFAVSRGEDRPAARGVD